MTGRLAAPRCLLRLRSPVACQRRASRAGPCQSRHGALDAPQVGRVAPAAELRAAGRALCPQPERAELHAIQLPAVAGRRGVSRNVHADLCACVGSVGSQTKGLCDCEEVAAGVDCDGRREGGPSGRWRGAAAR